MRISMNVLNTLQKDSSAFGVYSVHGFVEMIRSGELQTQVVSFIIGVESVSSLSRRYLFLGVFDYILEFPDNTIHNVTLDVRHDREDLHGFHRLHGDCGRHE